MGVIYSILNKINGKIYVGQTVNESVRFSQHKYELDMGKHHNNHLQNAWNKYGGNSFEFNILEHCDDDMLNDNEVWWIKYFDSTNRDKGYNLSSGGDSQYTHSMETREKISKSMKSIQNPMYNESVKNKVAFTRAIKYNSTGYYRVLKSPKKDCKQGFYWRYQWRDNGKRHSISSVDFNKLKQKVLAQGLVWGKIEEVLPNV